MDTEIPDRTRRLTLRRMETADAQALWPMLSDVRMWTHHPESRHEAIAWAQVVSNCTRGGTGT